MLKFGFLFLIFILNLSCSPSHQENIPILSDQDKNSIEKFAKTLTNGFNQFDHQLINSVWNENAFRARVTKLNKTQKSVFNYIFNKEIKGKLKYESLVLMNRINAEQGHAKLVGVEHFDFHSEFTLLLVFKERFDFVKYHVQIRNGKPQLVDFYSFKDNLWYSDRIENIVNLSTRYTSRSPERREIAMAFRNSDEMLKLRDTLGALEYLYEIPTNFWKGIGLSSKKLNLAVALHDSIYASVLVAEYEDNPKPYIRYLYHYYFGDSSRLQIVLQTLDATVGSILKVDSIHETGKRWN